MTANDKALDLLHELIPLIAERNKIRDDVGALLDNPNLTTEQLVEVLRLVRELI